jgi:hypothetical protein
MLMEMLHEHCREINVVADADSVSSGLNNKISTVDLNWFLLDIGAIRNCI